MNNSKVKNMKIKHLKPLLLTAMAIVLTMSCNHQNDESINDDCVGHRKCDEKERFMEAERVAFLTKRLGLSPDEAKIFWPVFEYYHNERKLIWKTQQRLFKKVDLSGELSEQLVSETLDSLFIVKELMLKNDKLFSDKVVEILSAEKALKLYQTEHHFKRHLLNKIKKKD